MEDKIKQMLDDYGLTESQLTCEELDKLKEEIKAKEQGMCIFDSVLDNPSLYYREKINLYVKKQQKISNKTPKPKTLFANKQNSTKN